MNIQQYQLQSRTNVNPAGNGMPPLSGNRTLDQYRMGIFGKDFPIERFTGRQQMPTASLPQQQPGGYQLPPFTMHSPGLLPPGGAPSLGVNGVRRRRRPMGYRFPQRDINGNVPGEWDYQMGQAPPLQPPMVPYGQGGGYQFGPPQHQQMITY